MSKIVSLVLSGILMLGALSAQVTAADHNFATDYANNEFGRATTSDVAPDTSGNQNVRVNKDSAYLPPSYGVFSGEIPTDLISPYHTQDRNAAAVTGYNNVAYFNDDSTSGFIAPTSSTMTAVEAAAVSGAGTGSSNVSYSYTTLPAYNTNLPVLTVVPYSDGSIGSLYIPALSRTVRVYEGTDLETMKNGVGHFTFTSQWDGNVGLASHNRGSASYFSGIWNLKNGDRISYTTKEGTRNYYVYKIVKVDESDLSYLTSTSENTLTLTTCVENQSAYRWIVLARE